MKFSEQISQLNEFFKDNQILIFVSFIIPFLVSTVDIKTPSRYSAFLLGSTYLLVVFLLFVLLYQLYKQVDITDSYKGILETLKNFNYVMFSLLILLFMFSLSIIVDYFVRYPQVIAMTTGMFMGIWISPFLLLIFVGIPLFVAKLIYIKAKNEKTIKNKNLAYLPATVLMLIAIPAIAYLCRNKLEDVLITPVFVTALSGFALLCLWIADLITTRKKQNHKIKKIK